jgi:hypothetical protein
MNKELFMKDIVIPRAQEYMDRQDYQNAFASVMSDMRKNKECREYLELPVMAPVVMMTMMGGMTEDSVTRFVNGIPFVKKEWELKGAGVAFEDDIYQFRRRFERR